MVRDSVVAVGNVLRSDYRSWGGTVSERHRIIRPRTIDEAREALARADGTVLACGNGRSYGDVGLNPGGTLIDCRGLDRFVAFDRDSGILECEAGVTLADILHTLCRPDTDGSAWLLPVSPGTRFVTVGGAIANDVHGKNHHREGCFGRHVLGFGLACSDGSVTWCTPQSQPGLFAATIGGLGLTGIMTRVRLQLRRVAGTGVEAEDIRMSSLKDFFDLAVESDAAWEYTAAWVDCRAAGTVLGRGIFSRARHRAGASAPPPAPAPKVVIPIAPPVSPLNPMTLAGFNALYRYRLLGRARRRWLGSYEPVLYPLDAIGNWNRLYGRSGFFQFQCAVPPAAAHDAVGELLARIAKSGQGSMLAVLKTFGDLPSPGLMSFPMPGTTLALDLPNRGDPTRRLLAELEAVIAEAGGRIYAAKDAVMSAATYRKGYPELEAFRRYIDPAISSAFARRVELDQRLRQAA